MASLRDVKAATGQVLSTRHRPTTVPQVVTLTAGSKRRSLLIAGDDDEMFMTRTLNVTPKTTAQHLIVRSDKSVAYVTNNTRLCSTFCTIEANYWQTRSIARPLCNSRATCIESRSLLPLSHSITSRVTTWQIGITRCKTKVVNTPDDRSPKRLLQR